MQQKTNLLNEQNLNHNMIKKLWFRFKQEIVKKDFYLILAFALIIFLSIIIIDLILKKSYNTKQFLNLLALAAIVTSSILLVILIIKKNFWKSLTKPFKDSKTSVGSFKEERKMRYMSFEEKKIYRQKVTERNLAKQAKPEIDNLIYYFHILIFFFLFSIFFIITYFI